MDGDGIKRKDQGKRVNQDPVEEKHCYRQLEMEEKAFAGGKVGSMKELSVKGTSIPQACIWVCLRLGSVLIGKP